MEFKTCYSAVGASKGFTCKTPSMTQQQFKNDCDVNVIVERYLRTGVLPESGVTPMYGDFSDLGDYYAAQEILMRAEEQFNSLPAKVRKFFDNNPSNMLQFLGDKANYDKAVELGLVNKIVDNVDSDKNVSVNSANA